MGVCTFLGGSGGKAGKHGTTTVEVVHLDMVVVGLNSRGVGEFQGGLAFLGLLGCHNHSTVGATGAIQGGGGGAFEDVDTFHIVHVDGGSGSNGTINHIDGLATLGIAIGSSTTQDDGTFIEGSTASTPELGTGHLTGQGVTHVGAVGHGEFFLVDGLGRVTDSSLLSGQTLSGNYHFFEEFGIDLKGDVNDCHAVNWHLGGFVTQIGNDQVTVSGNRDAISTIYIRQRISARISLNDNSSARDGLTGSSVCDRTFHSDVLRIQANGKRGENAHQQQTDSFHKHENLKNINIDTKWKICIDTLL